MRSAGRLFVFVSSCLAALCLMVGDGAVTKAQVPAERPNIVFLMTDDMDEKLLTKMPAVQSGLVRNGVKFNNAFVTLSLCCPSRATALRGQYAHNHNVTTIAPPEGGELRFRELGRDQSTIATWLQSDDVQLDYKTGLVGKYLNQYNGEYVPPGWDEWYGTVGNGEGRDGNTLNENGTIRNYEEYPTDLYRDKALGFIRNADQPFFLWVGYQAPHAPAPPAPRHADLYTDLQLPQPPSFNEADVSDKPLWVRSLPTLTTQDVNRFTTLQRNRVRSLQAVDESIDAIMDELRAQGELSNTYFVFTSDNGLNMGEHRWTKKIAPYEESIGVPLVVRGPGVQKNVTRNHIVTNNDFAPTFADFGQAETPDFVDGKSFRSLLGATPPATSAWRRATLIERLYQGSWTPGGPPGKPDRDMPTFVALRTETQTYVKYATGERELYNLPGDPYQLNSRHVGAPPQVIAQFDAWLEALRDCTGTYCRNAESRQDATAPDTTITDQPPNPSSSGSASFGFNGSDGTTLPTDLVFECRLDGTSEDDWDACTPPTDYTGLNEGPHTFEVRAVDEAGNVDATPASYSWTIVA